MTSRVGPKGQVVIPKGVRDKLGIRPGDDVVVEEDDGAAVVRPLPRKSLLAGSLSGDGGDLLAELEAEHRRELERDARRGRGSR